jgi:hypothetical protein
MASDALLTLIPHNTASSTSPPVSAGSGNEVTFSSLTAPTALGVGPNPATGINTANFIDLKTIQGTRKHNPLVAYILYDTASTSSGTGTALFTIDHADDSTTTPGTPGTWQVLHASDQGPINLTTTAATGQAWITIGRSKRYIRLNVFLAGTGGTINVSKADIRIAEP